MPGRDKTPGKTSAMEKRGPRHDTDDHLKPFEVSDIAATPQTNESQTATADRGRELTTLVQNNLHIVGGPDRSILIERALEAYVSRARRSKIFGPIMFGEAAWDMLLALYVTDHSVARHTVTGLLSFSGVAPTTALRWLNFLEREQLVSRTPNPHDARVYRIELTEKGRCILDTYFSMPSNEET